MVYVEVGARRVRASAVTLESECSLAERALLCRILQGSGFSGKHIEIGTAAGGTLKELINSYPDKEERPAFCVIDPLTYYDDQFEKITWNLVSAGIDPDSVSFWKGTTADFLKRERVDGTSFDFIFIDGDHRHVPVMIDLQWADLVRPGGVIALHDHSDKFPGVIWSVAHFLKRNPNFSLVEKVDTLILLRKDAASSVRAVTGASIFAARLAQYLFKFKRSLRKRLGRLALSRA